MFPSILTDINQSNNVNSHVHILPSYLHFYVDIDECADGSDNCHPNATCTNEIGHFVCDCNPGFTGNGSHCEGRLQNNKSFVSALLAQS